MPTGTGRHRRGSPARPATSPEPTADAAALRSRVGSGLGWSLVNNVLNRLGSIAAGVVLARILVPSDYGVFAVALVVLTAILAVNELGVSLAVVRWPGRVDAVAPTVATMSIVTSAGLYAACFVAAPTVAAALNAPAATELIRVLCVCVLFDGVAAVSAALITRDFDQRTRALIDVASFVVGSGLSVVLAVAGAGAWSMVWGFVLSNALASGLSIANSRWYRPGWNAAAARELVAFGAPLAGSSLLLFAMLNLDYIVVGHVLGAEALGFYLLAFNLSSWPAALVSATVRRVSLAGFSRLAELPVRIGESFARAAGLLLAVALPMAVLIAAYATPIVSFVYGTKWLPAVDALRLLCVLATVRVFIELAYDFLVALARTRPNLWLQVLWIVCLAPALFLGARWHGIAGVAAAHAIVALVVVVPAYLLVLTRAEVVLRRLVGTVGRPVLGGALVAATAVAVLRTVPGAVLQLLVGGVVAIVVCALVVRPMRGLLDPADLARADP